MAKGRTEASDRGSPGRGTAWGSGRRKQGRLRSQGRASLGLNLRASIGRSRWGGRNFLGSI